MIELTDKFKETDLTTALTLAAQPNRKLIGERYDTDVGDHMLVAVYSDGLEIGWESDVSSHYGDWEFENRNETTVTIFKLSSGHTLPPPSHKARK